MKVLSPQSSVEVPLTSVELGFHSVGFFPALGHNPGQITLLLVTIHAPLSEVVRFFLLHNSPVSGSTFKLEVTKLDGKSPTPL